MSTRQRRPPKKPIHTSNQTYIPARARPAASVDIIVVAVIAVAGRARVKGRANRQTGGELGGEEAGGKAGSETDGEAGGWARGGRAGRGGGGPSRQATGVEPVRRVAVATGAVACGMASQLQTASPCPARCVRRRGRSGLPKGQRGTPRSGQASGGRRGGPRRSGVADSTYHHAPQVCCRRNSLTADLRTDHAAGQAPLAQSIVDSWEWVLPTLAQFPSSGAPPPTATATPSRSGVPSPLLVHQWVTRAARAAGVPPICFVAFTEHHGPPAVRAANNWTLPCSAPVASPLTRNLARCPPCAHACLSLGGAGGQTGAE